MHLYVGAMPSQSLGVWHLDPQSLKASKVQDVGGLLSPSYLCLHPTLPVLYAAERSWTEADGQCGAVSAFAIAASGGQLQRLERWSAGGAFTAHLSLSADGRYLSTANPRGPTVAVFRLDTRGLPSAAPWVMRHSGRGATARQDAPWPHSCYFEPDGQRVFACDLGLDRIYRYDIDADNAALRPAPQPYLQVSSGAGARHLAMGLHNQCVYVANELDSTVSVFRYDAAGEVLRIVQTIATAPEDQLATNQPAELVVAPDGRLLYVTNRGHDSIAVFEIGQESGRLRLQEYAPAQGHCPRHIAIDAAGTIAAVCNQRSNQVALFKVAGGGQLQPIGEPVQVDNPTCAILA